jgi:hypothetical protein
MSQVIRFGRRHFLRGASGFALALPFLPSLLPRSAQAQAAPRAPRFIALGTQHGGVWLQNMFPKDSTLTEQTNLYSDHTIRRGALTLGSDGSKASLAPVLSAASSRFTSGLASKMNVIRGLDVPFYLGHNTGGHLGNYARNDNESGIGLDVQSDPRPTVDQVMAWSSSFYPSGSSIRERSIHVGRDGGYSMSWGYSSPSTKSGEIIPNNTAYSSTGLFESIYVAPETGVDPRKPVVDHVLESYKRLAAGNFGQGRRLSAADKKRLEEHMARVAELQKKLTVRGTTCDGVTPPTEEFTKDSPGFGQYSTDPAQSREIYQTFNDVIVAAMICGTTRIATVQSVETWSPYAGDWHQDVAHQAELPDGTKQKVLADSHQYFFEHVFLDLIEKLDFEEADGKTYLDNSLVMWSQESGNLTHYPISTPIVTAGSAAGFFNTGSYVDYHNRNVQVYPNEGGNLVPDQRPGILYSQWLASVLQSMGVPPSEFERDGKKGYGSMIRDPDRTKAWPDRLFSAASDIVPFLKA